LRARGGADEGRRVYERGDEPAVARRRRCWTGTVARGHRIRTRPGGGGTRAAVGKARAGRRGRGRGGRGPGRAAPGVVGEEGGSRGDRGGARVGQLAEGDGIPDWGRARANEKGSGAGARATVAAETRQFAVGHWWCARSVSGGGHHGGSKPGYWPVGGGPGYSGGSPGAGVNPERGATTGQRDGGRRVDCCLRATISRVHVRPPVPARIYVYKGMYIDTERQTHLHHRPLPDPGARDWMYISPRVRCCTPSRQVQICGLWPGVLATGTPSLRRGRPCPT
jgi:hypothetical protein